MTKPTHIDMDAIEAATDCKPGNSPENEIVQEIGALMPVLQHRWRLRIENDEANIISRQVTDLTIDYVNMEIAVNITQPARDTVLHEYLMREAGDDLHVYIDILTGNQNIASRMEFEVQLAEHKFRLDYASDDVAKHEIVLKIK